jgi:hypothetical protein
MSAVTPYIPILFPSLAEIQARDMDASNLSSAGSSFARVSVREQINYKIRNLALANRPHVDIVLNNAHGPHGTYVTSYSTMDTIDGTVNITSNHDIRFDDIEISFVGMLFCFPFLHCPIHLGAREIWGRVPPPPPPRCVRSLAPQRGARTPQLILISQTTSSSIPSTPFPPHLGDQVHISTYLVVAKTHLQASPRPMSTV